MEYVLGYFGWFSQLMMDDDVFFVAKCHTDLPMMSSWVTAILKHQAGLHGSRMP